MKKLRRSWIEIPWRALALIPLLLAAPNSLAHEREHTHPSLAIGSIHFLGDAFQGGSTAAQQVLAGTVAEDEPPLPCNHFYNPVTGQNEMPDRLPIICTGAVTAVAWAQTLWEEAIASGSYHHLGRVLHLLEDMTSPAHVHNDAHPLGDDFEDWGWTEGAHITEYITAETTTGTTTAWMDYLLTVLLAGQPQFPSQRDAASSVHALAQRVYDLTTFSASLTTSNPQPDSELHRMFDTLHYDWLFGQWEIDDIGTSYGICGGGGPDDEWWPMDNPAGSTSECLQQPNGVSGRFYIENSGGVTPAVWEKEFFPGPNNANTPLLRLYGNTLYPLAVAYGAGLLVMFEDALSPPWVKALSYAPTPSTDISITFSEAIAEPTVASAVSIVGASSGPHAFSSDFDLASFTLTLDPSTSFLAGEEVTVTLATSLTDLAGNGLDGDGDGDTGPSYQFTFLIDDNPEPEPTSLVLSASVIPNSGVAAFSPLDVSGAVHYNTGPPIAAGSVIINTGENVYTAAIDTDGSFKRVVAAPSTSRNLSITANETLYGLSASTLRFVSIEGSGGGSGYTLNSCDVIYDRQSNSSGVQWWTKEAFRTTDNFVETLLYFTNVTRRLDVRWRYYKPDGTQYGSTLNDVVPDPGDFGYGWWNWYWLSRGWFINGYASSFPPGFYSVKVWVDDGGGYDLKCTRHFSVQYDLTEHLMAAGVEASSPYDPINPRNTFFQDDSRAWTWANLDYVAQALDVRWDWHQPNGSLYAASDFTVEDPASQGFVQWDWYRLWGWIGIDGNAARNLPGDWSVNVFIRNAATAAWEHVYTDYFELLERPNLQPTVDVVADPSEPIDTDVIRLNLSASDNTLLDRVDLYWSGGTAPDRSWTDIFQSTLNITEEIGPYPPGTTVTYYAEAFDSSGNGTTSPYRGLTVGSRADLSVAVNDSADPVQMGQTFSYTVDISNLGPSAAGSITAVLTLPVGVTFLSASGMGWSCGEVSGLVTCTRPSLTTGLGPAISVSVTVGNSPGRMTSQVSVVSASDDPAMSNNFSQEYTDVNGACGHPEEVLLTNVTLSGSSRYDACSQITAGPAVVVPSGASVELWAPRIVIAGPFAVAGTFKAGPPPPNGSPTVFLSVK